MIKISSEYNYFHSNRGTNSLSYMKQGDKYLNQNRFNEALNCYQKALNINSNEINAYKKMAKAQAGLKNYKQAEENYNIYLKENPDDVEVIINLGEVQRQMGKYKDALNNFELAYSFDNSNDLAKRSILTTKNNMLAVHSHERAIKEKEEYAKQNLQAALNMTVEYLPQNYIEKLRNINFQFAKTSKMGGTTNIAQYENSKQSITVSSDYVYASPQVIAAYITHEAVHALDNDPYTSITEEQDAYEIATKFWIKNSNGIKDPEMDYAKELYEQSPNALRTRVEEIYTLRDPSIAKTSHNHPPQKIFHWNKTDKEAASQSLKIYDVIA